LSKLDARPSLRNPARRGTRAIDDVDRHSGHGTMAVSRIQPDALSAAGCGYGAVKT
jgi:hypothetical protein